MSSFDWQLSILQLWVHRSWQSMSFTPARLPSAHFELGDNFLASVGLPWAQPFHPGRPFGRLIGLFLITDRVKVGCQGSCGESAGLVGAE